MNVLLVGRGQGAEVGACLKALRAGQQDAAVLRAEHLIAEGNVSLKARTNVQMDGRGDWLEMSVTDAEKIVQAIPYAVEVDQQPGSFVPRWVVRVLRSILAGLGLSAFVAAFLIWLFFYGGTR